MDTYKKIVVLILLQSIVGYGIAQNCDFSKNETDKFTNARVLYTKPVNVISKKVKLKKVYTIGKIEMQVKYENDRYKLCLTYYFTEGTSVANGLLNDKLIILLADGSKIEAPCLQGIPSIEAKFATYAFSYNFGISEEDFTKLLNSDITDIRMAASVNPVDFSISDKIKTTEFFKCINDNK